MYTNDKSCQLTKEKLACNKIWTCDLLQLYTTHLPSQPTFNYVSSVHIIIYVTLNVEFSLTYFNGMEKITYQICKIVQSEAMPEPKY